MWTKAEVTKKIWTKPVNSDILCSAKKDKSNTHDICVGRSQHVDNKSLKEVWRDVLFKLARGERVKQGKVRDGKSAGRQR